MIISTKGRYGVRAMFVLAKRYGDEALTSIKYIASEQGISEQYLEQLFSKLKTARLIESVRGQKGGYRLNASPEEISVGQILRALEGPLAPSECVVDDSEACEKSDSCTTHNMWKTVYDGINRVVDEMSLADMLSDYTKNQNEIENCGRKTS